MTYQMSVPAWLRRAILFLGTGVCFAMLPFCTFATGSVSLTWNPSLSTNVVGYKIYYGVASGVYNTAISVTGSTNVTVTNLAGGITYYFAATAVNTFGAESPFSNETTYSVPTNSAPVTPVNTPPTLNPLTNMVINENAGSQMVNLSGITSGATNETQILTVTAMSSNPGLIPNPTVTYTSPNTAGTLSFTPTANGNGTATVTVTVNDNGTSNNIVARSFTVTVNAVNQPPTLNALTNVTINGNSGLQTVSLSGITSGATNEVQTLTVTAVSSNPGLIPNPTVTYTSPNNTGTLSFTPAAIGTGTTTITVTVNDNGKSNNIVTRSFTVTVNAPSQTPTLAPLNNLVIAENSGKQTVNLTGISSGLANKTVMVTVKATSSNAQLITTPAISYLFPNSSGTLNFTPANNGVGTSIISITVNNGQKTNNLITRSFTVTVASQGSIAQKVSSQPTNLASPTAAATLAAVAPPSRGQFALTVNGTTGCTYVVQASTDMVNWTSVQTNTAPFTFVETNASQFKQRFYRSFYLK